MKKLALLIPLTISLVATMAVASGEEEGGGAAMGAAMGAPIGEVIPQSTVDAAGDAVVFATPAEYQAKTGLTIPPYTEAPMLAAMVASGELPPVEDRLSEDPLVLLPLSEVKQIGRYTEKFQMVDKGWIGIAHSNHAMGMSNPYNFSHAYPQVFKSATPSDDASVWTFGLRRGMKWSDGEPFTTEDVRFWFEDDASNRELNPNVFENLVQKDGTSGRQNIIDEYTFQYVFDFPYLMGENIFDLMALSTYLPAHYLKQFHPAYNENLDALVKESGFNTWTEPVPQQGGSLGAEEQHRQAGAHPLAGNRADSQQDGNLRAQSLLLGGGPGRPAASLLRHRAVGDRRRPGGRQAEGAQR